MASAMAKLIEDDPTIIHEARRFLERCYRDGGALDVEALCVVGGEACWQVALNVSLLIDRGNALEAMTLGAAACLKHVRCRVATGTGDSVQLADVDSVVPLPLPLTRLPVAVPVVDSSSKSARAPSLPSEAEVRERGGHQGLDAAVGTVTPSSMSLDIRPARSESAGPL